ncbi:hypothetical protein HY642_01785 [Candidatus Woesearchaeota archaeon]|nr:hypothetical protein [Candidatus Woesearchaeota archaeon]
MQDYVKEAFDKGECAVGRFWGQTHIYLPPAIAQYVCDSRLKRLAAQVFSQERLNKHGFKDIYRDEECCFLDLPSVLNPDGKGHHPEYDLPQRLAQLILKDAAERQKLEDIIYHASQQYSHEELTGAFSEYMKLISDDTYQLLVGSRVLHWQDVVEEVKQKTHFGMQYLKAVRDGIARRK